MDRKSVYIAAFQRYGQEVQLTVAIEELSELQKEICKFLRGYNNIEHLAEEVADVHVILEQIELMFGLQNLENDMNAKVQRLFHRMESETKRR